MRIGVGERREEIDGPHTHTHTHPIIPTFPFVPLGVNVTGSRFDLIPGCASHLVVYVCECVCVCSSVDNFCSVILFLYFCDFSFCRDFIFHFFPGAHLLVRRNGQ